MSRRSAQRARFEKTRSTFANDAGLPFGKILQRDYVLDVLATEGHRFRSRSFDPLVVLWGWLSQCLSQDKSLNEAVSRIVAHRAMSGLPTVSANSASYSNARARFPEEAMSRMAKEIGRRVHNSADDGWRWNGREVFLADGTSFSMPDTSENQLAYPQSGKSRPGVGFPLMRAVALISLPTGAVVNMAFGKFKCKGTGENSLLRQTAESLEPGSIAVADRYYPTFATIAMLQERQVDIVSISHHMRKIDFSEGIVLGPNDHIVEWRPSAEVLRNHAKEGRTLPETIMVREFCIEIDTREGGKEPATIVSTIVDPTVPQKELSDLYYTRWNCELDIRSIKHALHMDVLRCKTPEMVRKEIWAHLLAWNLIRGTMVESAKRSEVLPRQISVKGTMQAVESFTPALMAINGNPAIYYAMLATVAAHQVGNRPGRQEPRFKKRRPCWNQMMNKPRHTFRRRLASEGKVVLS